MTDSVEHIEPMRTVSGTRIVIGMFVFGILATAGMGVYWRLHLAPFFPLQKALAEEFPGCSPRVEGGRHKQDPLTLRIVVHVEFKPDKDAPHSLRMIDRIVELAREKQDLGRYELLQVHLVERHDGKYFDRIKMDFPVADLNQKRLPSDE